MTTLEEMVDTGCAAINGPYSRDGVRKVVLAVLEKHVQPMLAEAWLKGNEQVAMEAEFGIEVKHANEHANRVLARLTKQSEPAKHEA